MASVPSCWSYLCLGPDETIYRETRPPRRLGRPVSQITPPSQHHPHITSEIHNSQMTVIDRMKVLNDNERRILIQRMKEVHNFFDKEFQFEAVSPEEIFPPMRGLDIPNQAKWSGDFREGWHFNGKFISIETIAHEYIHAVVQRYTNLGSGKEQNALHESLADIFASIFKQYKYKQNVKNADWQMADDEGKSYRSLKSRPVKPFPALTGKEHEDAAIPNYAFYRAAVKIGGESWKKIGKIWCEALKKTRSDDSFYKFYCKTRDAAEKLFPQYTQVIIDAWQEVGIKIEM